MCSRVDAPVCGVLWSRVNQIVCAACANQMRIGAGRQVDSPRAIRPRYDERTKTCMQRRLAEGLSKKELLRCLKHFIAREVFHGIKTNLKRT